MSDPLDSWLKERGLTVRGEPPMLTGLGLQIDFPPALRQDWTRRIDEDADALEGELTRMAHAAGVPDGWFVARSGLRLLLTAQSRVVDDALHLPLSKDAAAALVHTGPDESLITFLRTGHLDTWHTDLQTAHNAALDGLDRVLAEAALEVGEARGYQLGMLSTHSPFKASLLLAPGLRAKVGSTLGWPLHAVAPCRDFLYLFEDVDLVPLLANTVMHEFDGSAHPISAEVFRVSDEGLEAIGSYAED
jgi:hypothetical protein